MKIGIMGTHGAGKTTYAGELAAKLRKRFPDSSVGVLHEIARTCPFSLNKKSSVEAQMWLYHSQVAAEIEMADKYDILVCDRTVLDTVVYGHHAGFGEFVGEYLYTALSHLDTYDFLYWMQAAFKPVDDGFRDPDPAFQDAIDSIFTEWINDYGINVKKAVIGQHA